jgi:hypothetical protein
VLRVCAALMALVWIACASLTASAGGRDYGGTLNVGPNFKQGGQYEPPSYGSKTKRSHKKHKRAKKHKYDAPKKHTVKKRHKPASKKKVDEETSSGEKTAAADENSKEEAVAEETCKRFDATTGQTITVPCE